MQDHHVVRRDELALAGTPNLPVGSSGFLWLQCSLHLAKLCDAQKGSPITDILAAVSNISESIRCCKSAVTSPLVLTVWEGMKEEIISSVLELIYAHVMMYHCQNNARGKSGQREGRGEGRGGRLKAVAHDVPLCHVQASPHPPLLHAMLQRAKRSTLWGDDTHDEYPAFRLCICFYVRCRDGHFPNSGG